MKSELIVDVQPGDVTIALLEDSRLVSLQKEQDETLLMPWATFIWQKSKS